MGFTREQLAKQAKRLSYTAGFFDGEGCIVIQKMGDGQYVSQVTIGQKVEAPLIFIQEAFGGRMHYAANGMYVLGFRKGEMLPFLDAISEELIVKQEQVKIFRAYHTWLADRGLGGRWTVEQRTKAAEFYDQLRLAKRPWLRTE